MSLMPPNLQLPTQLARLGLLGARSVAQSLKVTIGTAAAKARPIFIGRNVAGAAAPGGSPLGGLGQGLSTYWVFSTGVGQPAAVARITPVPQSTTVPAGTYHVEITRLTLQAITITAGTSTYSFPAIDPVTGLGAVQTGYVAFQVAVA